MNSGMRQEVAPEVMVTGPVGQFGAFGPDSLGKEAGGEKVPKNNLMAEPETA